MTQGLGINTHHAEKTPAVRLPINAYVKQGVDFKVNLKVFACEYEGLETFHTYKKHEHNTIHRAGIQHVGLHTCWLFGWQ